MGSKKAKSVKNFKITSSNPNSRPVSKREVARLKSSSKSRKRQTTQPAEKRTGYEDDLEEEINMEDGEEDSEKPVLKSHLSKLFLDKFNEIYNLQKDKNIKLFKAIGDPKPSDLDLKNIMLRRQ